MKRWTVSPADGESAKKINSSTDLGPFLSGIVAARGLKTTEALAEFFNLGDLSDPFLLSGMEDAAAVINDAVDSGEKIAIFGDYDCDGICATAILYDYLLNMGADVLPIVPERDEGYGLSSEYVQKIADAGATLIVTVDNGVAALNEARLIHEQGMKLVVTDHHQCGEELPEAEAVVDPHQPGDISPFKDLCGAGVALKLCAALDGGSYDAVCEQYLELAAIATVADVMPLYGENRFIVSQGMTLLKNSENLGLLALLNKIGTDPEKLTSTGIAFYLAPKINAASRFGTAKTALDLLLTEDPDEAERLASELCNLVGKRREAEGGIMEEIAEKIASDEALKYSRVLIVSGHGWHRGIIGIIAARLVEIYEKPAAVISIDGDGIATGSLRSVPGFGIFDLIEHCRGLLIKGGGHELAGGITLNEKDIPDFIRTAESYAREKFPEMPRPSINADKLLRGSDITVENAESLKRLQPCGTGNPEPIFALSGAVINSINPLSGGDHTRLGLSYDGASVQLLMFRTKTASLPFKVGDRIDAMANMQADEYSGTKRVTLVAVDYRPHGCLQDKFFAGSDIFLKFRRHEDPDPKLLMHGAPKRSETVSVYNAIKESGGSATVSGLYAKLSGEGINSLKLRIILAMFEDSGLVSVSPSEEVAIIPVGKKADLMSGKTAKELKKIIDTYREKVNL